MSLKSEIGCVGTVEALCQNCLLVDVSGPAFRRTAMAVTNEFERALRDFVVGTSAERDRLCDVSNRVLRIAARVLLVISEEGEAGA
jgi:hypothetical protein